jgi:16S rRNA (cytosine1407-C5)-methyltransferase
LYPQFFDCILVDAPCSGEGTGFKSDAAFKRRKQESINSIVGLQKSILASSRQALRPGGILIYSTCTINPFENELQLTNWLDIYGHEIEQIDIT